MQSACHDAGLNNNGSLIYISVFLTALTHHFVQKKEIWSALVVQRVKPPTLPFSWGADLGVLASSPTSGSALSMESA